MKPDPHTDAPETAAEQAIVTRLVCGTLEQATVQAIITMEQAKGGLQHVSPEVVRYYTEALRALDSLLSAVR